MVEFYQPSAFVRAKSHEQKAKESSNLIHTMQSDEGSQ